MLRDIYVIKGTEKLYHIQFGTSIEWDSLEPIIGSFTIQFKDYRENKTATITLSNYQFTYFADIKNGLYILFISDLTNDENDLQKQIEKAHEEFMSIFEDLIKESSDPAAYESFNPVAEMIHQNLRPKIALIGFPGVGKTTITKLIKAEEIPMEHIPTVTGDIVTIKIGKLFFHIWDFAGQEEYSFLWPSFLQNSDGVLVITDSNIQNIDESKFFLDLAKREVPNARMCVIANKQDIPDAIDPKKIARLLTTKTYGMVAINPENRAKMIQIIGELLNLSPQISPMIQPLLDRDKALEEAEELLEKNDFEGAIEKFKSIAELSRELGDDRISLELLERIKMIESFLEIEKTQTSTEPEILIDSVPPATKEIVPETQKEKDQELEIPSELNISEISAESKPIPVKKVTTAELEGKKIDLKPPSKSEIPIDSKSLHIKDLITGKVKLKPPASQKKSELEIPKISVDSKPIHDTDSTAIKAKEKSSEVQKPLKPSDKPKTTEAFEPTIEIKEYFPISPLISEVIKANSYHNFISRNIHSLLSNNYIEIDFHNYDKHQIIDLLSNFTDSSLNDFVRNCRTQIDPDEQGILPDLPAIKKSSPIKKAQSNDTPIKSQEKDVPSAHLPQENIVELIEKKDISIEDKIKTLKDSLAEIETKMNALKQDLENNNISRDDYKTQMAEIRAYRRQIQDKISDLSIQKIKSFDMKF